MNPAQDKKTSMKNTVDDLLFVVIEGLEEAHGEELTYSEVTIRTDTRDGASTRVSRTSRGPLQFVHTTGATALRPMLTTEVALTDAQIKKIHADWAADNKLRFAISKLEEAESLYEKANKLPPTGGIQESRTIEESVHKELREQAQSIFDRHGICFNNVNYTWIAMGKDRIVCGAAEINNYEKLPNNK